MSLRRPVAGVALVLLAATGVAACGGGGDSGGDTTYVEPKGAATETISVEASNFSFDPDRITADAGIAEIELTATNGIHDLVFDDAYPGFIVEADGSGGTSSKKIDLEPGTFDFYCTITGHRAAGMEGTLTVR